MTIVEEKTAGTGGAGTRSEVHVAAALDPVGGLLGTQAFAATAAGYADLVGWLAKFGDVALVGVEGTGSYGAGLARYLTGRGITARLALVTCAFASQHRRLVGGQPY